nr:MAG TPA: hypothetical protein [Caudoviricetes sp.]
MTFIDATCIKGQLNVFSSTIEVTEDNGNTFTPLDLNNFTVRLRVLGAPTADAKVLIEKMITQNSDIETLGQIDNPNNGSFTFTITKDDTNKLGFGKFPVKLDLLDAASGSEVYSLTLGDEHSEFNAIRVVQV